MVLYKYLPPARVDVLQNKSIRFTQPGDFNDPFEFRPNISAAASEPDLERHLEQNLDRLVDEELAKYGVLLSDHARGLRNALLAQKPAIPQLVRLLEPQTLSIVGNFADRFLNANVGVLCLSEVRDSVPMWGLYGESHHGFVIGFDSEHPFFRQRRSESDEFGYLRQVAYQKNRPQVTLTDTSSREWFHTKSINWADEREWRIVRILSEAQKRVPHDRFPICLFDFPPECIREIIIGLRAQPTLTADLRTLGSVFPNAALLRVVEDRTGYGLIIREN
jgi:hypothetical protein